MEDFYTGNKPAQKTNLLLNLPTEKKSVFIINIMTRQVQESTDEEELLRLFENLGIAFNIPMPFVLLIYDRCFRNFNNLKGKGTN